MDRIGKPRGLVRYDSQRGLDTGSTRFMRARVWVYVALGVVGLAVFSSRVMSRTSFQANALRTAGMPFTIVEENVRNLYTLHIQNKTDGKRVYSIAPSEETVRMHSEMTFIIPQAEVELESFDDAEVPVFVEVPRSSYNGAFDFDFTVTDSSTGESEEISVKFRGP